MTPNTTPPPAAGELTLTIRPEPAGNDHRGADPHVRLRRLLKMMLRAYGWRCTQIAPAPRKRTEA